MHTPTPAAPRYSIFDHANGQTVVCFRMAGENFNMPKVDPATNGVDEWTLRMAESGDVGESYRMPVLPDGIPYGECLPLDEPLEIPTPAP